VAAECGGVVVFELRDTLIASIALAHGARLATRNVRHFSDTTISLINPFPPAPDREPLC
jgi:predicted nucleic acid-binding protein